MKRIKERILFFIGVLLWLGVLACLASIGVHSSGATESFGQQGTSSSVQMIDYNSGLQPAARDDGGG